jgi:hypothetical protein
MIPMAYLLLVWLTLVGIFAIMTLLTVLMSIRHSVASFGAYASTLLFLVVTAWVLIATGIYFLGVDWSQPLQLFSRPTIGLNF